MYVWGRNLLLPDDCSTLRFHPRCPRGRERCPALIAAMYQLTGSDLVAIQRVYFNDQGEKLGAMMLGPVGGTAMKLSPHQGPRLFICEGLETGLALLQMGYAPQWALGSCGAIERMPVLPAVTELVICADHDPPGTKAAEACAQRWNANHKRARIRVSPIEGRDFADDLGAAS